MAKKTSNIAIKVENLNKEFKLPHERHNSLKSIFVKRKRKKGYEIQKAVNNVSFEVKEGEFFGIVGRNGSGKSTLLKCLAGVYSPNKGSITINGKLVPFIELGVGFNPELSGRDNIFLNGALLGFSRQEMTAMYDEIVEFAELEEFMDQKLKNYSSGMQVRLAFSIAIRAKGDILLLDEVLAVGDSIFQQKCFSYFHDLKRTGQTVLLVSHNSEALRQYCDNGVLLEGGELVYSGKIDDVLNKYTDIISDKEEALDKSSVKKKGEISDKTRHGSGKIRIKGIVSTDSKGASKAFFRDIDSSIKISINYQAYADAESPIYGIVIRDGAGNRIFSSNNMWLKKKSKDLKNGDFENVHWIIPNIFNTGKYTISPAVTDKTGKEVYDTLEQMFSFRVRKKTNNSSLTNVDHEIIL